MDSLPAAALGHFVMKVANLGASYEFYSDLGLRKLGYSPMLQSSNCVGEHTSCCFRRMTKPPSS